MFSKNVTVSKTLAKKMLTIYRTGRLPNFDFPMKISIHMSVS